MAFQRRQLLRTISLACGSGFLFGRNSLRMAAQTAAKPTNTPADAVAADQQRKPSATETEKVTGIGGFFFRTHDPKGLAMWYQQHAGNHAGATSYEAAGLGARGRADHFRSISGDDPLFW